MLIIPAIDIKQGQAVRLTKGQFDQLSIYSESPQSLAQSYVLKGAKRLHLVDLDGAKTGNMQQLALIKELKQYGMAIQVGGGIRTIETAKRCILAGLDKLVIGSIAVSNKKLTEQIIALIQPENIVLAFDVHLENGFAKPAIHGWQTTTNYSLWDLVNHYQQLGVNEILCTDIACDGMMNGPNFTLYEEAIARFPQLNWQASGGIRHERDLEKLSSLGLAAAIIGKMLYETDFDLAASLARIS